MRQWLRSFGFAWQGIRSGIRQEAHLKFHLAATLAALAMGFLLSIGRIEWLILLILIGLVWIAELFNTALEVLSNKVEINHDPQIKLVKDLAAGSVLIAALIALVGGILLFSPYICAWI
ncbi:MAG: diacylglycerol kinase family protein [Saprospiraceae bacterium]